MDSWLNEAHDTAGVDLSDPDNLYALRRAYYGLVTYVDRKVGEIVAALEETGQLDSTVIMFTSDHGDMLGERGMVQKRCFYEWSSRVPLLLTFPDGRFAGQRVSAPVSLLDLAPTMLDIAGVPDDARLPMQGVSVLLLLDGDTAGERVVFSEYHVEKVRAACFMVRAGDYKYIYIHGHGSQLFNLAVDPDERTNLVSYPDAESVRVRLHTMLLDRFDIDGINAAAADSVRRRELIKNAMQRNGTRWDYVPQFGQEGKYVR